MLARNIPTGRYNVTLPTDRALEAVPYLIDRVVRYGRDNGYGDPVNRVLAHVLQIQVPRGGFVASDGRNVFGQTVTAPAPAPVAVEEDLDEIEDIVEGWSPEYAAEVAKVLATRIA